MVKAKVINGYEWREELGRGAWGKVRKVIHTATGEECAVKVVYRCQLTRKIRNGLQLFYQEYESVRSLDHPNIIKYRELDDHSSPDKLYLFMELCAGSIINLLPQKSKAERTAYIRDKFKQLLEGLVYLHSRNIAHHDIKGDNVLVDKESVVKISDFGVAEHYDPALGCRIFFGTPAYQAPEIAGNITGDTYDGAKADVWSAGVILYQLFTGGLPFTGESVYLLLKSIESDPVPIPSGLDKQAQDLLRKLLNKTPKERCSAQEALLHPWITGVEIGTTEAAKSEDSGCCRVH